MDEKEAEARPLMGTIFLVTKFARTIYNIIYIRDSRLNRPESVSLASLARQLLLGERSEPHTGVFNRDFA